MFNCNYCNATITKKNIANGVKKGAAWGAVLLGGPITMAMGAGYLGLKSFQKHVNNQCEVKCPHCGKTNYISKEQYERLD